MEEVEPLEEPQDEAFSLGEKQIWAVGGGKGGVGKSFVSANLAVGLAQRGHQVIVVDADLGGANMHTCLGIPYPSHTLADFIDNRFASLEEILLPTVVPRLRLISGASDILSLANPQYSQKQKIIRHLRRLKADYILLDLGAGTTYNVLDFFNLAHRKLIVVTAEPTSIQNGYGFIKSALFRHLVRQFSTQALVTDLLRGHWSLGGTRPETVRQMTQALLREVPEIGASFQAAVAAYQCKLILNMTSPPQDQKVYSVVRSVSRGFLDLELEWIGSVPRDEKAQASIEQMSPVLLSYPESEVARKLRQMLERI